MTSTKTLHIASENSKLLPKLSELVSVSRPVRAGRLGATTPQPAPGPSQSQ